MSSRRIAVLDCGVSRVSAGVFVEGKEALRCESFSGVPVPSVAIENWPVATAEVIGEVLANCPRRLPVVLVLPSHALLLKQMRTPRVSPTTGRQVLEFAVGQTIPHVAGELVWDALTSGTYDAEIDHLVIAAKVSALAPILHSLRKAKLEIGAILPSLLALRAAESMCSPATAPRRLLIETGEWGTAFLQTDGARFAVRSLGSTVSQASLTGDTTHAGESGEGTLRLAQEATRTLLHFNRQNNFEAPDQVILASEKAWVAEMKARLGEQLKCHVEILEPGVPVPVSAGTDASTVMAMVRLLGGAAIGLGRVRGAVNLLPGEIREQESSRRRKPWLLAAAALAVSALLPPLSLLRAESALRRLQSAELEKALVPLQAREKRMQAQQTQIAALNRERERLRLLANGRTSWLGFLAALQARLAVVEDTWLERLQTVAPEGEAPMKLVVHGCMLDRGEPPVAEKMRNLVRELRGIPHVSAVEGARFDTGRAHLLRFELVLVIDAAHRL